MLGGQLKTFKCKDPTIDYSIIYLPAPFLIYQGDDILLTHPVLAQSIIKINLFDYNNQVLSGIIK